MDARKSHLNSRWTIHEKLHDNRMDLVKHAMSLRLQTFGMRFGFLWMDSTIPLAGRMLSIEIMNMIRLKRIKIAVGIMATGPSTPFGCFGCSKGTAHTRTFTHCLWNDFLYHSTLIYRPHFIQCAKRSSYFHMFSAFAAIFQPSHLLHSSLLMCDMRLKNGLRLEVDSFVDFLDMWRDSLVGNIWPLLVSRSFCYDPIWLFQFHDYNLMYNHLFDYIHYVFHSSVCTPNANAEKQRQRAQIVNVRWTFLQSCFFSHDKWYRGQFLHATLLPSTFFLLICWKF